MDLFSYLLGKKAGGGGTTNYNELSNKPQINNVELSGNKTASDLGLVSPTDYATSSKGGVIKYDSTYGLYVNQNGALYGAEKSYANYENFSSNGIISKGTLENVITGKGLISNTNYGTSSRGGTVKSRTAGNFSINADGLPYAEVRTYEQYTSQSNDAFIGKGTLENIITGKNLDPTLYVGYDATKTQILKNINGTLTWVDE